MRKILLIAFAMLFSSVVMAADLTQQALQGDWVITEFQGAPDSEGDMWQFEGNKFYQILGKTRVPADEFTVSPGVIDLGYAQITVESFDGKTMEAIMARVKYKLVKK